MEEQLDILDIYLKLYDEKNYRNTFYNLTYSNMIQHFIDYKIYDYDELYGGLPNESEIISRYKKEIIVIDDIEIKKKLLPLILFIGEDFHQKLYENDFFNDLKEFLLTEFKEINFDIVLSSLDKDSSEFESQSKLKEEVENFDFNTILDFNFSQPTIGNNQYPKFMYFIAEKIFFEEYCNVLNDKNSFNFLFLTNVLERDYNPKVKIDKNRRIKLLQYITGKNKLILEIRFLRDLVWYEYDVWLIKKIILNLSKDINIWESFSNYYLNSPSRYVKLFQSLGELLHDLNQENIDILIDSIRINTYTQNDNIKALNNCFLEANNYIIEKIFQKWLDYIDSYNDYFSSILLTDVQDIIIECVKKYLTKDIIDQELKRCVNNIEEINNKWFKSNIEQNNYFYKNMSKLFVYGVAVEKYNLKSIKVDIVNICNKSLLLNREGKYGNNKTTLELFNEYII